MKDIPKRLHTGIRSYLLQNNGCYIKYDDLDDCHDKALKWRHNILFITT
jgi:hypothetical protein